MIRKLAAVCLSCAALATAQGPADIDFYVLVRALRTELAIARSESRGRTEAAKHASSVLLNLRADPSRLNVLRALAGMRGVSWTDLHSAAAEYRFAVGETVVEPRSPIHMAVERWQPRGAAPAAGLTGRVNLLDSEGKAVAKGKSEDLRDLAEGEFSRLAPEAEGRYLAALEILNAKTEEKIAEGRGTVWVVKGFQSRLAAVKTKAESLAMKSAGGNQAVWLNTVLALVEKYSFAGKNNLRMASQVVSPVAQTMAPFAGIEPLDPIGDLAWAEKALETMAAGKTPAPTAAGWIPFAARSRKDQSLRLAHVWWPGGKPSGIGVLFGDDLTHERSWTDVTPAGDFLWISPSAKPGSGGWEAAKGEVEELVAALFEAAGLEAKPVFVLMHGNGAQDPLHWVWADPARYAAVAIVAGSSDRPLPNLPKQFPPAMIVEAGGDTVLPAETLRRDGLAFQRLHSRFEYFVARGASHDGVRGAAMPKVIEFFTAVAAGTWKPSGVRVPLPGAKLQ